MRSTVGIFFEPILSENTREKHMRNWDSFLFLIFLAFSGIGPASTVGESCTLNLSWGHGGPGHLASKIKKLQQSGKMKRGETIAQGCGTPRMRNNAVTTWNKYQVWQTGFNGHWMGELSLIDNGGFNPIMSKKSRAVLAKYSNVHDKDKLYSHHVEGSYIRHEDKWANILSKYAKVSSDDLIEGVSSVGFMRLTHYHWAALMKRADELIEIGACKEVSINFACHDQIHNDPLTNDTYQDRYKKSQFKHMKIDEQLLMDSEGQIITYRSHHCTKDLNGHSISTVPSQCGESLAINAEIINQYKLNKHCRKVFDKVDKKYHGTRKLAGRSEVFNNINDGFMSASASSPTSEESNISVSQFQTFPSRYDRFGSYPVNPNAMDQ